MPHNFTIGNAIERTPNHDSYACMQMLQHSSPASTCLNSISHAAQQVTRNLQIVQPGQQCIIGRPHPPCALLPPSTHCTQLPSVTLAQLQAIGTLVLGSRQKINSSTQAQRTLASIRKHMMDEREVKLSQEPTKRHLHRKMLARLLFISKVRRGSGRRTQVGLVV